MAKYGWPTPESWRDLMKIVWNLEMIVEDAPRLPGSRQSSGGGLLGNTQTASVEVEPQELAKSRLAAGPDHFLDSNLRADLERVLSGISHLGGSRTVRLENLRRSLLDQPAYAWVTRQTAFTSALETARFLAARGETRYLDDAVDFKLIAAAWLPLLVYAQETSFGYPTRDEIKTALDQAEALTAFLRDSGGLVRTGRITFGYRGSVEKLAKELRTLYGTKYKKPKDSDPVAEVEFGIELAAGLKQQFGAVSPRIISAFLDLIEYVHDDARVRTIIRMAEERGK